MNTTKSRWRLRAREVIQQILHESPALTSVDAARAALRGRCPWPRTGHPYQCWLREAREAVKRAKQDASRKARPTVLILCSRHRDRRLWLHVDCGWCRGTDLTSCLMCGRHQAAVDAIAHDREFLALRQDALRDSRLESVLGDWLEDRIGMRAGL